MPSKNQHFCSCLDRGAGDLTHSLQTMCPSSSVAIKAGTCFPDWLGASQQGQAELGRRHAHQSWRVLTCLESGLGGVGRALCHSQKPQGTRVGRQRGAGEGGCSPGSVGREAPSEAGPQAAPRARPARPGHTAPCWRSRPESAASQTACPSRRVWGAGRGHRLLFLRRPGARRPVSNTEVPVGRLRGVPQGPASDVAEHEACPGTHTPCPTHQQCCTHAHRALVQDSRRDPCPYPQSTAGLEEAARQAGSLAEYRALSAPRRAFQGRHAAPPEFWTSPHGAWGSCTLGWQGSPGPCPPPPPPEGTSPK